MRHGAGLLLLLAALAATWGYGLLDDHNGRSFAPHPDAVEYAATAHSQADLGTHRIYYGERELPCRYPPGWPFFLSLAVHLGLRGEALLGVMPLLLFLHSALLALWAVLLWRQLVGPRGGLLAGLVAGVGGMCMPLALEMTRLLMSELWGSCLVQLCLAAGVGAICKRCRWLALACGVLAVSALATRTALALVLVPPGVWLLWQAGAQRWRLLLPLLGGVLGMFGLVAGLLWLANGDPWRWSGYWFWQPGHHAEFWGRMFHHSFVWGAEEQNLRLGLTSLSGWPHDLGAVFGRGWWTPLWVLPGWGLGLVWLWRRGASGRLVAGLIAVWLGTHLAVFSCYYFPTERFHLPAACLWWVLAGLLVAACWQAGRRFLLLPFAVLVPLSLGLAIPEMCNATPAEVAPNRACAQAFARYLAWPEGRQRDAVLPFDPVRAQALGLWDAASFARAGRRGVPPVHTAHGSVLLAIGQIPDFDAGRLRLRAQPGEPCALPQACALPGWPRLYRQDEALHLQLRDGTGGLLWDLRVPFAPLRSGRLELHDAVRGALVAEASAPGLAAAEWQIAPYQDAAILAGRDLRLQFSVLGQALVLSPSGPAAGGLRWAPPQGARQLEFVGYPDQPVSWHPDWGFVRGVAVAQDGQDHLVLVRSAAPDPCLALDPLPHAGRRAGARAGGGEFLPILPRSLPWPSDPAAAGPDSHLSGIPVSGYLQGPLWRGRRPALGSLRLPGPAEEAEMPAWSARVLALGARPVLAKRLYFSKARTWWELREDVLCEALGARLDQLRYGTGSGALVDLPAALGLGLDLTRPRQCLSFDSGLELFINLGPTDWLVAERVLPPWGFLARRAGRMLGQRVRTPAGRIEESRGGLYGGEPEALRLDPAGPLHLHPLRPLVTLQLEGRQGDQWWAIPPWRARFTVADPAVAVVQHTGVLVGAGPGESGLQVGLGGQQLGISVQVDASLQVPAPAVVSRAPDGTVLQLRLPVALREGALSLHAAPGAPGKYHRGRLSARPEELWFKLPAATPERAWAVWRVELADGTPLEGRGWLRLR